MPRTNLSSSSPKSSVTDFGYSFLLFSDKMFIIVASYRLQSQTIYFSICSPSPHSIQLWTHSLLELSSSWESINCGTNSRTFQHFMEPKYSLPCSKEPFTSTYSEPDRSILILFTHLCLGLPSGLFPSGFPTNILYAFLFSPIRATYPALLILLGLIILIVLDEGYKLWSFSVCSFLQLSITSSLFNLNVLLSNLFSDTLSLCSSLKARDQVLHTYRTTGKIIVLYFTA
jgi:hypothetical protein